MSDVFAMGTGDEAILNAIHAKLNKGQQPEPPKAPPQRVDVGEPIKQGFNPEALQQPVEPGQEPATGPVEGQEPTADAQPQEGEQEGEAQEAAPAEAQTFKVRVKDEQGNDVEQDVTVDELRSGYMRHADYTRKTQALAKERQALPQKMAETEKAVTQATAQFQQALQYLQSMVTTAAAPELGSVDWNRLAQENPGEYIRLTERAKQVNATLANIQNAQKEAAKIAERQRQKALQEAVIASRETLNRELPGGFSDDRYQKIMKGAVDSYGFTPEEVGNVVDARIILAIHDGLEYRALKSGRPIAQQKVAQAPLAVRPKAAPTPADARNLEVQKRRDQLAKSGSIDDAVALMQAKRQRR